MSKIKKKLKVDENKLDEIIEESLGDDDIRQYLPNATILKYSDLCKYNDIDEIIPNEKDYAIILYEDSYYGVQSAISNQYFVGKNPDYPNNVNPLNPGLEEFGSDLSIICSTYYIPADKVAISPYKERT